MVGTSIENDASLRPVAQGGRRHAWRSTASAPDRRPTTAWEARWPLKGSHTSSTDNKARPSSLNKPTLRQRSTDRTLRHTHHTTLTHMGYARKRATATNAANNSLLKPLMFRRRCRWWANFPNRCSPEVLRTGCRLDRASAAPRLVPSRLKAPTPASYARAATTRPPRCGNGAFDAEMWVRMPPPNQAERAPFRERWHRGSGALERPRLHQHRHRHWSSEDHPTESTTLARGRIRTSRNRTTPSIRTDPLGDTR